MIYKRIHISIAASIAAMIYFFIALQVCDPLGWINGACLAMGTIATFVAFYNYMLLAEKFLTGKVIMVGGRFVPVEDE